MESIETEKICKNCSNWRVIPIIGGDDVITNLKVGRCKLFNGNDIVYYDCDEDLEAKVSDGKMGGQNLVFHENFGCIHFSK